MKIYQVSDPEFSQYGRIIRNYEVKELLKAMETTPLPEDVLYLPSVKELEELPVFSQMSQGILQWTQPEPERTGISQGFGD